MAQHERYQNILTCSFLEIQSVQRSKVRNVTLKKFSFF
jgi:hypothetical protein